MPERTPLNARVTGSTQMDGFRIQKILFESHPNFPVTALLYLPGPAEKAKSERLPAILMAPGHSPAGKAGDFAFASAFARAGFAVLSYDPIGQGERLQYPDPAHPETSLAGHPTGEHGEAGIQPTLIGDAVALYFLWDAVRAVDYLQSRPEIDPARIGAFGCSGGGAITALASALDDRIAVAGSACYITSYDTLLPALGPQDAEQTIPNFLSGLRPAGSPVQSPQGKNSIPSGKDKGPNLDFPDWVELAAPRPYAIISTTSDMFPFAGAQSSEAEARRFYSLFGAEANLAFITGPGGHGNLRPILPDIIAFYTKHLHPPAWARSVSAASAPAPDKANAGKQTGAPPKEALQVTTTGQVSNSFPSVETVHTLTLKRAGKIQRLQLTPEQLQAAVREVTRSAAEPEPLVDTSRPTGVAPPGSAFPRRVETVHVPVEKDLGFDATVSYPDAPVPGRHPAHLMLSDSPIVAPRPKPEAPGAAHVSTANVPETSTEKAAEKQAPVGDLVAMKFAPRPSPPGTEEIKAPQLGPWYITELRSELVGKTLLGMRVDDTIHAVDYLAARPDVDLAHITAEASGHLALVLLHAAILDARLAHITVSHLPPTYADVVKDPLPKDAPQDVLPGVLRVYDTPDLIRALGSRVTVQP